jgi:phosphoglycolate/pyridoxal phosphate phosphatase family enzyme
VVDFAPRGGAALDAASPEEPVALVLIFDLDGVVYLGDTPIPGAIPALHDLAAAGHRLFFLTNNSTRSRRSYAEKLTRMGFPTEPEQVMTSAYATGLYLQSISAAGKTVYVVGESGLCEEMERAGLRVLTLEDATPADYVVAGLDRDLTYAKLSRAHHEITVNGATFIATNRDSTYPMETAEIPGGGAIVAPIEVSSGVRGATIGKPEPHTWQRILDAAGARSNEALMVGDRPDTDIFGARRIGIPTALVLSGVTRAEEVAGLAPEQQPDHVLADLAALPRLVAALSR